MYRLGEENPWFCHCGTSRPVDFCLWVLEVDGLHVPPFESHAGGDGEFRALGLDAARWEQWVKEVVDQVDQQFLAFHKQSHRAANDAFTILQTRAGTPNDPRSEALREYMQTHPQELMHLAQQLRHAHPGSSVPKAVVPPEIWRGSPPIGERLRSLWTHYHSLSEQRFAFEREWEREDLRRAGTQEGTAYADSWSTLEPYQTRLESLLIHRVPYAHELVYPVPPCSAIVTVVNGQREREVELIVQAAEALIARLTS